MITTDTASTFEYLDKGHLNTAIIMPGWAMSADILDDRDLPFNLIKIQIVTEIISSKQNFLNPETTLIGSSALNQLC